MLNFIVLCSVQYFIMLAVSFSKGATIFLDDRRQQYSFHCMQNQKRELHVFLKKFYLPSLSAGMILSVAKSSCIVKVGSSWVGDV